MPISGKGTMGWCRGFKLHLLSTSHGGIMIFILAGGGVYSIFATCFVFLHRIGVQTDYSSPPPIPPKASYIYDMKLLIRSKNTVYGIFYAKK